MAQSMGPRHYPRSLLMSSVSAAEKETEAPDRLTGPIVDKLNNPPTSSDFDFHEGVNQVLADVGMSAADGGGQLTFYCQDSIVPSRIPLHRYRGAADRQVLV